MVILLLTLFGNKIKEVADGDIFELNGIMTKKRAKVLSTNEFSGHGKKEDLLNFMQNFSNLKSVLINHGEEDVKLQFAKYVMNSINPPKGVAILNPSNYIRIGSYGIIKSYPSSSVDFDISD